MGIGATLAATLCAANARAADLVWPLDVPPVLTSSFGEPRSTHLHAGIDLGTGGRTGVVCRAVADGWVARMRMSPFGYGKALYVQLDTGELAVYAHLERFAAPLAERAWREQKKRAQYSFDIYFEPNEFPVRRGDIVAWSGDSGVGFPHLHFEMRRGDSPLNPQTSGFAVADAVTPSIRDVSVLPLDATSHVEGAVKRRTLKIGKETALRQPVVAAGRLGFAVRCLDRAARGPYRQAPYRYEVRVDGRTLYRARHERFDYAHNHHIVLDYDQERLVRFDVRSFLLFGRLGNQLPERDPATGSRGVLLAAIPGAVGVDDAAVVGPGRHEVEIEVADVGGRTRSVRFPLIVSHPPTIQVLQVRAEAGSLRVECEAHDADGDSLSFELHASRDGGVTWEPVAAERPDPEPFWTARHPDPQVRRWALRARVRDPSGLQAMKTWVSPRASRASDSLHVDITTAWEYGRLRVEIESERLLQEPPGLWLQRPDGRRRQAHGLRQSAERRWVWVADVAELEDLDGLVVSAVDLDGRRRIVQRAARARVVPRQGTRVVRDLHPDLQLEFEARTLLENVALRAQDADPTRLKLGPELEPAGLCVRVEPGAAALDRRVRVRARVEPDAVATNGNGDASGHVGLFVRNRRGLRFLSADVDAAGEISGETRFLGTFVLLRDATPPRLSGFRAQARAGGAPRLSFRVQDAGAALADGALDVQVDGVVAIPEWDPETGKVLVHPTVALEAGTHRLRVRAVDRVGNRSTRAWTFEVP